jgi:ABC-type polysaccharide/polyol phosphate transport system ATPase subunit
MSDIAIKVENVSKRYLIGGRQDAKDGLRHRLEALANPLNWFKNPPKADRSATDEFWALKDVSFEIKQGDVVGFIGRNGAGKSTLLKVLSRITEPTRGRITMNGRVASLLEVGTGFHPELTGRENIFLNGAILGMSRVEIKRKFDEIVAFSEVEQFLETPVKRYSSGMYVRLAFAVAAHLEPEILIVDEVLAVGDAQFQKKCLGKMQDVSKGGRTVLFVSHNMAAVSSLTQKVIHLEKGRIVFNGSTEEGLANFLHRADQEKATYVSRGKEIRKPFLSKAWINFRNKSSLHISGDDLEINFEIRHLERPVKLCFSFQIVNQFQHPVVHCWNYDDDTVTQVKGETTTFTCRLPKLALNVGRYSIHTYLAEQPGGELWETLEGICDFEVEILARQTLFGWRPNACAYLQDFEWKQS